jgi:hypothetical protein
MIMKHIKRAIIKIINEMANDGHMQARVRYHHHIIAVRQERLNQLKGMK